MEAGPKILFIGAALLLLVHFWRGWRSGVMRQLFSLIALALAFLAAMFGRELLVPFLRPLGLPDRQLSIIGAVLAALVIYILVSVLSAVLFKNTSDQKLIVVRFGYGLFGGLIGLVKGLFVVWLLFVGIRLVGTIAEVRLALHATPSSPEAETQVVDLRGAPGPIVKSLAAMKEALEQGPIGAVMDRLDPVPTKFSRTLPKLVRVLSDRDAVARLQHAPGVEKLIEHPSFVALTNDPEIARAAQGHDYRALMQNPRLLEVINDEGLRAAFESIELEKALDFALASEPQQ